MNYCSFEEVNSIPFFNKPPVDLMYLSDGREFTIYRESSFYLDKFAKKLNMKMNSNNFREYLQKDPTKLLDFIHDHRN